MESMCDWRQIRDRLEDKSSPNFERLNMLLRKTEPGKLPFFELAVDREIMAAIMEVPSAALREKINFYMHMGYDYVPCKPNVTWPRSLVRIGVDSASYPKASGREWLEEDFGPVDDFDDLAAYPFPTQEDINYGDFDYVAARIPKGAKIVGAYSGIFENTVKLMGMTHLMECLLLQPELVESMIARVGGTLLPIYRHMANHAAVGAILMGDDMGFKTQTFMCPELLRAFVLPWHKKIAEAVHHAGKPFILHSCGKIDAIMDDLIDEVRIDAIHSFQDNIKPVTEVIREHGRRIGFLGGIDVDVLCRQTPEYVRHYVQDVLKDCGNSYYALGSGNTVANYISIVNYLVMLEEGAKFRGDI